MKKQLVAIISISLLVLALQGCVISVQDDDHHTPSEISTIEKQNKINLASININDTFTQVKTIMGVADFSEARKENNDIIKTLYYRTHRVHKDGLTTKDECTQLTFINDVLVSMKQGLQ